MYSIEYVQMFSNGPGKGNGLVYSFVFDGMLGELPRVTSWPDRPIKGDPCRFALVYGVHMCVCGGQRSQMSSWLIEIEITSLSFFFYFTGANFKSILFLLITYMRFGRLQYGIRSHHYICNRLATAPLVDLIASSLGRVVVLTYVSIYCPDGGSFLCPGD
jgi:hypothetical protein